MNKDTLQKVFNVKASGQVIVMGNGKLKTNTNLSMRKVNK